MASNEDGNRPGGAPRPTAELRGVTFMGAPAVVGGDTYRVKFVDGRVEGPMPVDAVRARIAEGELTGSEGVSKDGTLWIPIRAVPTFASALRDREQANDDDSLFGPASGSPRAGSTMALRPLLEETDATMKFDAENLLRQAGRPNDPPPLSASNAGVMDGLRSSTLSDNWSSLGVRDQSTGDVSVARSVVTDPAAASGVPGLQRASATTVGGPRGGATMSFNDAFGAPGSLLGDAGASQLPLGAPNRPQTQGIGIAASEVDLPRPAMPRFATNELPTSRGAAELPGVRGLEAELPRSAQGLPASTMALPGVMGDLPQSSQGLPRSAQALPQSSQGLPGSASQPPAPRTAAFAGLGQAAPAQDDLPASRGGLGGRTLLDDLDGLDALFAQPGGMVPGQEQLTDARSGMVPSSAPAHTGVTSALDDDPFGDMDFGGGGASGGNASSADAFFSPPPAAQPAAAPAASVIPAASEAGSTSRPARNLPVVPILATVAVAGLVGAAGWFLFGLVSDMGTDDDGFVQSGVEATPAPATAPAVTATVGTLDDLRGGGALARVGWIEQARTAVAGSGGDAEARARLVIALGLNAIEDPDNTTLTDEMGRLDARNGDAPEGLALLARGAAMAMRGQDGASEILAAQRRGEFGAWAALYEGFYYIQQHRGVRWVPEELAAPTPAENTEAVEGSGAAVQAEAPAEAPPAPVVNERTPLEGPLGPQAFAALDAAISADSGLVPARYWRAKIALEAGDAPGAIRQYEDAIELSAQHVPSWIGLALAQLANGQLSDADARIQRVIDELQSVSTPAERSNAFLAAAEISIARLQPSLAIDSLLSALQENPSNRRALHMLGEQYARAGQYAQAVEYFQPLLDSNAGDAELVIALSKALLGLGRFDDAQSRLEAAEARFPRDARLPYFLGRVAEGRVEFEIAGDSYRRAMQVDPGFLPAYVQLAELEVRADNLGPARQLLDDAWRRGPDEAAVANAIGEAYLKVRESNKAVAAFRRSLELDSSYPDARLNLTENYLNTQQNSRAIEEIESMVRSGVDSPRVRFLHARALHALGQFDRAIEELLALLESDSGNVDYLMLMGRSHFGANNIDAARTHFVQALERSPGHEEAQYYIGRSDLAQGRINEAIAALTAVAQRSARGELHYWLGVALEEGRQGPQALAEYVRTIDDDIGWSLEHPEVFYRRGRMYFLRGAASAAYRDLRVLLTLRPTHAGGAWYLARFYYDNRDFNAAISMMQLSLSVNPAQPEVRYQMGLAYLNLARPQLDAALAQFERARQDGFASTQPELHRRLGYVYRDLGRRPDAISSLRAYLEQPSLSRSDRLETENEIRRLGGTP